MRKITIYLYKNCITAYLCRTRETVTNYLRNRKDIIQFFDRLKKITFTFDLWISCETTMKWQLDVLFIPFLWVIDTWTYLISLFVFGVYNKAYLLYPGIGVGVDVLCQSTTCVFCSHLLWKLVKPGSETRESYWRELLSV